jgi:hypothetical protein
MKHSFLQIPIEGEKEKRTREIKLIVERTYQTPREKPDLLLP